MLKDLNFVALVSHHLLAHPNIVKMPRLRYIYILHTSACRGKGSGLVFWHSYFVTLEGVIAYVGRTNLSLTLAPRILHAFDTKTYRSLLYIGTSFPSNSFSSAFCAKSLRTTSRSSSACSNGMRWMRDHIFSLASSLWPQFSTSSSCCLSNED